MSTRTRHIVCSSLRSMRAVAFDGRYSVVFMGYDHHKPPESATGAAQSARRGAAQGERAAAVSERIASWSVTWGRAGTTRWAHRPSAAPATTTPTQPGRAAYGREQGE